MRYTSTRALADIESAQAITQGISADGGLFVPKAFPALTDDLIDRLCDMDYQGRAFEILRLYLTDFTDQEIRDSVAAAYTGKFEHEQPAPLHPLRDGVFMLELWHGPTCAFKDMALQLLPQLLTRSAKKVADGKTMVILVATSGDTGKAALDGFADVPDTNIIVFYPQDGVSPMQKLQMTTQSGNNVAVCAIRGNFDDAQTGVKQIFADPVMHKLLDEHNMEFSSANSINFGRLVPQIVYYVSAYCDLLKNGTLQKGEGFNIVVPTGNFGNILAGFYAKQMGIPIRRFICASNQNNVLTDFIQTGVYDRNRAFYTTTSPSMDILISSNLERLLFHLYDGDTSAVLGLMQQLAETGKYEISDLARQRLQELFFGGFCNDDQTAATIRKLFNNDGYLCDTHTAVAAKVFEDYQTQTGDLTPAVIVSTASPYKFAKSVLTAIDDGVRPQTEFEMTDRLAAVTKTAVPAALGDLKSRPVLHTACCDKTQMAAFIRQSLGL